MTPGFHPGVLSEKQRQLLRVSGFDPAKGQGWPLMVQGGDLLSARVLANRRGLGTLTVDADGFAHFTANRDGCRIHYAEQVATFEDGGKW